MTSTIVLLLVAVLSQGLPTAMPATELRTRADSEWMVATAAAALPEGGVLSVGKVRVYPTRERLRSIDDATLLAAVARTLELRVDTALTLSQMPACASDAEARGARGYRVAYVSIERQTPPAGVGKPGWFHYVVWFEQSCRHGDGLVYTSTRVRFDAVPDAALAFRWAVGSVEHSPDPPPEPAPSFRALQGRFTDKVVSILPWGALAFPCLALLIGRMAGRRGLVRLLVVWSAAGLALTVLAGTVGVLLWLLVFFVPAGAYVAHALAGTSDASAPPRLGRASVTFAIVYVIGFVAFVLAVMGVFAS